MKFFYEIKDIFSSKLFLAFLFSFLSFNLQAEPANKSEFALKSEIQYNGIGTDVLDLSYKKSSESGTIIDFVFEKCMDSILKRNNKKNITSLNLSGNLLTGLPQKIKELSNLEVLNLSNNKFKKLPKILTKLKSLKKLDLSSNKVSSEKYDALTVRDQDLTDLEDLDASKFGIFELTHEIGNIENLEELNLAGNGIVWLTSRIGKLKKLKRLNLSKNQLIELPEEIGELESLIYLNISDQADDEIVTIPRSLEEKMEGKKLIIVVDEKKDERSWARYSLDVINYYLGRK